MALDPVMKKPKVKPAKPKSAKAKADKFPPPYEFRFRAGPYKSPQVNVGVTLHDEYLGDVRVDGFTDAPIPWPASTYSRGRHAGLLPVLTGDLVRAVCEEDEITVAHYWGVTRHIVNEWKKAIAECEDSNAVALNIALKRATPEFRKKYGYR